MSQVKILLLATSHGRANPGLPNALASVAGVPSINYFMASLKLVHKLQPWEDNVFIVANNQNYQALVAWASDSSMSGGFPSSNILNTMRANSSIDVVADVAFAVKAARLEGSHLVIATLDVLYRPNFNLQRIVEHSLIRAKDTVVFHRPPPGHSLTHHVCLKLDDFSLSTPNPKVLAIEASPSGPADGIQAAVLAPLVVIRNSSVPDFLQPSTSASVLGPTPASCQTRQLGWLVHERLLGTGKPLFALEEDLCIDISSAAGLDFADSFMKHLLRGPPSSEGMGSANQALQEVTKAAQDLNVLPHGNRTIETLIENCSEAKRALLDFYSEHEINLANSQNPAAGLGRTGGSGQVPERFVNPGTWRHEPRKQNPMYSTSNHGYGLKRPTQMEMPDTYSGSSQQFSGTFYGGVGKVSSMVTSITTSKVHNALDDF